MGYAALVLCFAAAALAPGGYVCETARCLRICGRPLDAGWLDADHVVVVGGDRAAYALAADGSSKRLLTPHPPWPYYGIAGVSPHGRYVALYGAKGLAEGVAIVDVASVKCAWKLALRGSPGTESPPKVVWQDGSDSRCLVWLPPRAADMQGPNLASGRSIQCVTVDLEASVAKQSSPIPGAYYEVASWSADRLTVDLAGTMARVPLDGGAAEVVRPVDVGQGDIEVVQIDQPNGTVLQATRLRGSRSELRVAEIREGAVAVDQRIPLPSNSTRDSYLWYTIGLTPSGQPWCVEIIESFGAKAQSTATVSLWAGQLPNLARVLSCPPIRPRFLGHSWWVSPDRQRLFVVSDTGEI